MLAAGCSTRFGSSPPKQLATFDGEPPVLRALRAAAQSQLEPVVVVVGHMADAVTAALESSNQEPEQQQVAIVLNPDFGEGQSTSVKTGLSVLRGQPGNDVSGALFLPIDQPFVDAATLDRMLVEHRRRPDAIVRPCFGERSGSPVLFPRSLFGELDTLVGDSGGRQLFRRHPNLVIGVQLPSIDPLLDADSPEELAQLQQRIQTRESVS